MAGRGREADATPFRRAGPGDCQFPDGCLPQRARKPDAQKFLDEASRLWPEAWTFRRQTSNLLPPEVPAAQRNKLAMKASGVTFFLEDMDMAGMP